MAWSLFEERYRHCFLQTFLEKYRLVIEADIALGGVLMKSKTEIRWLMEVKNITQTEIDLHLITLSHRVLESNNPIINDIANVSNTFGDMFSELELKINDKGNIVKIKNLSTIQRKWEWVKQDMQKHIHENEALKDVILLNDELYSSAEMIKKAIASNEFFSVYFHLFFGKKLPSFTDGIEKNNLLNTHKLKWAFDGSIKGEYTPKTQTPTTVSIVGFPQSKINKEWLQEAYGRFEHLPLQNAKPTFEDKAIYTILPYGKIKNGVIERNEIVLPDMLYAKYRYELMAEETTEEPKAKKTLVKNSENKKHEIPPKNWLIID